MHSWRGGADREQVRQLETGTTAIHHGLVFPFLLGQRSTHREIGGCFFHFGVTNGLTTALFRGIMTMSYMKRN